MDWPARNPHVFSLTLGIVICIGAHPIWVEEYLIQIQRITDKLGDDLMLKKFCYGTKKKSKLVEPDNGDVKLEITHLFFDLDQ